MPFDAIRERQHELTAFIDSLFKEPVPKTTNQKPLNGENSSGNLDPQTVLNRALKSQKGPKIKAFLDGKNCGLPSDSEGDLSLCNYLVFFCGQIPDDDVHRIVDTIYRNSKRYRPKWGEIHRPADGGTYGRMTIEKAIHDTIDRYQSRDGLDGSIEQEETALWSFEDAEIHIEKQKDRKLTNGQKIELAEEILGNSDFGPMEESLIKDLLKKITGINKSAMDRFDKDRAEKDDSDNRTHSELSACYIKDTMPDDPNKFAACEGKIWKYSDNAGIFEPTSLNQVEIHVGDSYQTIYCKRGSDYKSIATLVYNRLVNEDFFKIAPRGLPGATVFFCVDDTGSISRMEYNPKLRQRFKLGFDPDANCQIPMFNKFLNDCFPENIEQLHLVQEISGAMLTGLVSKLQVAVFLYGPGANGKSVFLGIIDGLVSEDLKCSVKPDAFANEYYRAELAGKCINIVGEIDKEKHITADFKDIVGCDVPVTARMPYERPFRFTPLCGHIFAGNGFPQTRDHTFGFYRRWRFVHFKHTVPETKRIPDLTKKILANETPGILSWALEGAKRLIENNFQLTATSEHEALVSQWKMSGDSVMAFLNDEDFVLIGESLSCPKAETYKAYKKYCLLAGVRALGRNKFYQRILERFSEVKPPYKPREFEGFTIFPQEYPD